MPHHCAAFGCKNRAGSCDSTISFHSFPLTNAKLLKQWNFKVRRKNWKPTRFSKICSEHFVADDFIVGLTTRKRTNRKIKKLKEKAVPTIFDFPSTKAKELLGKRRCLYTDDLKYVSQKNQTAKLVSKDAPAETKKEVVSETISTNCLKAPHISPANEEAFRDHAFVCKTEDIWKDEAASSTEESCDLNDSNNVPEGSVTTPERVRLLEDFLIPALDNQTYGPYLMWDEYEPDVFCLNLLHQASSTWDTEASIVFIAWDAVKGRSGPKSRNDFVVSKQRFRSALRKMEVLKELGVTNSYIRYRIEGLNPHREKKGQGQLCDYVLSTQPPPKKSVDASYKPREVSKASKQSKKNLLVTTITTSESVLSGAPEAIENDPELCENVPPIRLLNSYTLRPEETVEKLSVEQLQAPPLEAPTTSDREFDLQLKLERGSQMMQRYRLKVKALQAVIRRLRKKNARLEKRLKDFKDNRTTDEDVSEGDISETEVYEQLLRHQNDNDASPSSDTELIYVLDSFP